MNMFPQSKPYGVVLVTGQKVLQLHAGAQRREAFSPGDYAYLHPHWYRVNDQRALQCVGTSAIPARKLASTSIGEMMLDLECVLNQTLSQHTPCYLSHLVYLVFVNVAIRQIVWSNALVTRRRRYDC